MADVLTVDEVADWLRIHRRTLYRLLRAKKIPAFRIGSDWRFNRDEIDAWRRSGGSMPEGNGNGK